MIYSSIRLNRYIRRLLVILTFVTVAYVCLFPSKQDYADEYPSIETIRNVTQIDVVKHHVINETSTRMMTKSPVEWTTRDTHGRCTFTDSFDDNMNKLKAIKFPDSELWVRKLGFDRLPVDGNTSRPVLVSGADKVYFDVLQGLVKTVHEQLMPRYPSLRFIVYDLGLYPSQRGILQKYCRCDVRPFPFQNVPPHVRKLSNFAFKPIIMNELFQEFGQVWWVDCAVRFITNDLDRPLKYLKENGALFFTYGPQLNVALHTHRNTFEHFEEDPCPYMHIGEVEAGNVAFTNNEAGRLILNRWVSCALDASCLAPPGVRKGKCPSVPDMNQAHIGACHRFDQSVLSIILRRLYHRQNDYPAVDVPMRIITVLRGDKTKYFPSN